jgi:MATE family multidrug resistance protein
MGSAVETLCRQAYRAKNYDMLGTYLQRSTILLMAAGMLVTLIYVFSKPILLLGESKKIASTTTIFVYNLILEIFVYAANFLIKKFLQDQSIIMPNAFISFCMIFVHLLLIWMVVYRLGWGFFGALSMLS